MMHFPHYIIPVVEISIIAVLINTLLSFIWNSRSKDLMFGVLLFVLILFAASWLNLPVLKELFVILGNIAMIAGVIIFQPELRQALSKLSFLKPRRTELQESFDFFLEQLASSTYRMSSKRMGALIVLQRHDSLERYSTNAVPLHADFSPELCETIFTSNSPLHDGAIIIYGQKILAAAVILPLAENTSQLSRSMGTRHRAALGITQLSDALVIVVSEETGNVSIAREGVISSGIRIDRFQGIIRSVFGANSPNQPAKNIFSLWKNRSRGI